MPLGALLALAGIAVAPALRGRQVQIGDADAVIGRADLGVAAEIADEDYLVDAASHGISLIRLEGSSSGCRILSIPADVPTLFLSPQSTGPPGRFGWRVIRAARRMVKNASARRT